MTNALAYLLYALFREMNEETKEVGTALRAIVQSQRHGGSHASPRLGPPGQPKAVNRYFGMRLSV